MKRQTKIICTLGPASQKSETIAKMAKAGMDIVRINFSHGNHRQHQKLIDAVRTVNKNLKTDIKILQDLEGYRIRIGHLRRPMELKNQQYVTMSNDRQRAAGHIPLEFDDDIKAISKGMDVFIDDGRLALKVIGRAGKKVKLEVLQGGLLKSRKGVNIPGLRLKANILTEKDQRDIEFGIRNRVDYVAQSFVRNKQDILRVGRMVKPYLPDCRIIAKIENKEGVKNINRIMNACDGIMIARGDLGVSLPIYQIPLIQKDLIRRCTKYKKLVITATQMLESMTENTRPTRAEVSDIANAILDGTDCVMLSAETAVGRFPVESVRMMCQVIDYTEQSMYFL
jgi:pyruvate kinase